MPDVNFIAVLVATVVAFVLGSAYYFAFADRLAAVSEAARSVEQPPAWQVAVVELVRNLVLSSVVGVLAVLADVDTFAGGLLLGLALWVGFPLVLWSGAVFHERTPWRLAVIHGGDWLVKLLAISVIVSVWQ
jgi:amino acid permease